MGKDGPGETQIQRNKRQNTAADRCSDWRLVRLVSWLLLDTQEEAKHPFNGCYVKPMK